MNFDTLLDQASQGNMVMPEGWGQGRAAFGGLVAALLYQRLATLVPAGRLRSMTVNFIGPVAPGPARLEAEVLRQGKSVTQAQARLVQGDQVQAIMLASFGGARSSSVVVDAAEPPACKGPEAARSLPVVEGITPEFLQHFDVRWAEGYYPFTGGDHGNLGGWARFREGGGKLTPAHLMALVDVWPPAVLGMLKAPAPASSMTWTLELVGDIGSHDVAAWYQYRAQTDYAADGYMHAAARLWDNNGCLLALSRQTAVVFG